MRETTMQLKSVAPMDRLLNQRGSGDDIQIEIHCIPRGKKLEDATKTVTTYNLKFGYDAINKETCSGKVNGSGDCEVLP